jgi:hypothetical protein
MDQCVLAAIAKWPGVPDVFGWLSLTARGQWLLRGEPIANAALREFIGRNYACDERGRWFFQNGPQRVYVALELAPWVLRRQGDGSLRTHTGVAPWQLRAAALVDGSAIMLVTDLGAGAVDDRDAEGFLQALSDGQRRPLGERAVERAIAGKLDAYLAPACCGLAGAAVLLQRLTLAGVGAAFGFEREPSPG